MLQIITFLYKPAVIILFHTKTDRPGNWIKKKHQTMIRQCAEDNSFDSRLLCFFFSAEKGLNVMLSSELTAKLPRKWLTVCALAFYMT